MTEPKSPLPISEVLAAVYARELSRRLVSKGIAAANVITGAYWPAEVPASLPNTTAALANALMRGPYAGSKDKGDVTEEQSHRHAAETFLVIAYRYAFDAVEARRTGDSTAEDQAVQEAERSYVLACQFDAEAEKSAATTERVVSERSRGLAAKRHTGHREAKARARHEWDRWQLQPDLYFDNGAFTEEIAQRFSDADPDEPAVTTRTIRYTWLREWEKERTGEPVKPSVIPSAGRRKQS